MGQSGKSSKLSLSRLVYSYIARSTWRTARSREDLSQKPITVLVPTCLYVLHFVTRPLRNVNEGARWSNQGLCSSRVLCTDVIVSEVEAVDG